VGARPERLTGIDHDIELGAATGLPRRSDGQPVAEYEGSVELPPALGPVVGDLLGADIDQRSAAAGEDQSLKLVADNALREVERICLLIKRLGEVFEAPGKEKAVAYGREVIGWWSGVRNSGAQTDPKAPFAADAKEILTPREYEVLGLIREGCSNKEGGLRMNISYRTFESHRAEVMRKFGAKNAADLIRLSSVGQDISASDRSVPNVGD